VDVGPITPLDLPAIARLHEHFWGDASDVGAMAVALDRLSANPDYALLVVRIDGVVAGTATGVVCHGLYGGYDSYLVIEDVVVDPTYRRRGVATALLGELERFGRARDCTQVLVQTEVCREDAVALYVSAGYDGVTRQGFKKRLDPA
jgi:ribosomal protein S18 acetylase RimI-like enzyme